MKQFFLKHRKRILYTLYAILLAPALLFFLFPSEAVMDYIRAYVHSQNPEITVTFEKVSPCFPLGLKFTGAECRFQGSPEQKVFTAKKIILRPRFWSLFGKNPEYRFTCLAYDGSITGQINISKDGQQPMFNSSAELKDIHINENSPLPPFIKDRFDGILEGSVTHSSDDLFSAGGTGEAILTLTNGSFKFSKPFLDIDAIDLRKALLKADLKDQALNISDLSINGDDFLVRASGVINLKDPLKNSRLNLKGEIEPTAVFMQDSGNAEGAALLLKKALKNGKLLFEITGYMAEPKFGLK